MASEPGNVFRVVFAISFWQGIMQTRNTVQVQLLVKALNKSYEQEITVNGINRAFWGTVIS